MAKLVGTVHAADDKTVELTSSSLTLIRYYSDAYAEMSLNGGNMSLDGCVIINGDERAYNSSYTFYGVESNEFRFSCIDDEQKTYSTIVQAEMVDYVRLTCNITQISIDGNGIATVKCNGNYFNKSFGAVTNEISVVCRYMDSYGNYGDWVNMYVTPNGNTYSASADLELPDYQGIYTFEVEATDLLSDRLGTAKASTRTTSKPLFHWGENDFTFEVPVTFNGGINGGDVVVAQGELLGWTYRIWGSGFAECWKSFTTSVRSSDWSSWGSLYTATLVANDELPFTIPVDSRREFATIRGAANGFLSGGFWLVTDDCTGEYYVCSPTKYSSTYNYITDIYVAGMVT